MVNTREIEEVLNNLKKEIAEEGVIFEERFPFEEMEMSDSPKQWDYCYNIDYYAPLVAHKKKFGKIEVLVKKMIRKMNKFLILPMTLFQSDYNRRVQEEINKLYGIIERQDKQIRDLQDKVDQFNA